MSCLSWDSLSYALSSCLGGTSREESWAPSTRSGGYPGPRPSRRWCGTSRSVTGSGLSSSMTLDRLTSAQSWRGPAWLWLRTGIWRRRRPQRGPGESRWKNSSLVESLNVQCVTFWRIRALWPQSSPRPQENTSRQVDLHLQQPYLLYHM